MSFDDCTKLLKTYPDFAHNIITLYYESLKNYEESFKLLKLADGEVKTAVVMKKMNIDIKDAREQLKMKNGSIRKILINSKIN